MQTEVYTHSGRDSYQRRIEPGRYVVTMHGAKQLILVEEDPATGALGFRMNDRYYLIEELDPAAVLSRLNNLEELPRPSKQSNIDAVLVRARAFREELARLERQLAMELGCTCGDGSPLWDGISAAVRDGMGTAVDLLDLAGALRR